METSNPSYKKQGIHAITSIFTVDNGMVKVLLIKRNKEPFKDMWSLIGGAVYNTEEILDAAKREIYEKTGLEDIDIYFSGIFDAVNRSPVMRMVAISYIGVIDIKRVMIYKKSLKTADCEWFPINNIPNLAYDHNEIVQDSLECLKKQIVKTDILKTLFPSGFTIPEVQKVYELILDKTFDRRNFRKKLLSLGLIQDTMVTRVFEGKKPAKVYKFKKIKENKNVF